MELQENFTMYIDFETCLCNTDAMVLKTVYRMMRDGIKLPFATLDNICDNYNTLIDSLSGFTAIKKYKNPLYEFLLEDTADNRQLCDNIYNKIIYREHNKLNLINDLKFSNYIKSIRPLIMSNNFKNLYIYMDKYIKSINEYINDILAIRKFTIVVGNKKDFFSQCPMNSYIIQSLNDIEMLGISNDRYDIICPSYQFNKDYISTMNLSDWESSHSASIYLISPDKMILGR